MALYLTQLYWNWYKLRAEGGFDESGRGRVFLRVRGLFLKVPVYSMVFYISLIMVD